MNKLELNELLVNVGIYKLEEISSDEIENVDKSEIYYSSVTGQNTKIKTDELSPEQLHMALLAKQIKVLKQIKGMCVFFVVYIIVSIIVALALL